MAYGESLLSKIIDIGSVKELTRHGIERDHFATETERATYDFIRDYAAANAGKAPDYRTVVAAVPDFTYMPQVGDSTEWLAGQLKRSAALRMYRDLFVGNGRAPSEFEVAFNEAVAKNNPEIVAETLRKHIETISQETAIQKKVGIDVKADRATFLAEYERRKAGESFKIWQSRFPSINEEIGGYIAGNVYVTYGRSGRGKSIITLEEAVEAALQGANVLIWSMEMPWYEVMVRLYVSVSGREAVVPAEYLPIGTDGGFDASRLRQGKMNENFEVGFRTFLETIDAIIPGNIIVRGVDDPEFTNRSLRQLESDIIETNADVVIIDPFYYLDYERNTSKTAGGDAAETSKKLRRLAGRLGVVVHAITQAEEDKNDSPHELKLPVRADVKKTKQLLEDAALLIAIDTVNEDGRGLIGLNKGRDGGEGTEIEIVYLPRYGVVREPNTTDMAQQFTQEF